MRTIPSKYARIHRDPRVDGPSEPSEIVQGQRPQPPMICLAFEIKAVVAAIRALNFHTPINILPEADHQVRPRRRKLDRRKLPMVTSDKYLSSHSLTPQSTADLASTRSTFLNG
jgi:hypothetical protein